MGMSRREFGRSLAGVALVAPVSGLPVLAGQEGSLSYSSPINVMLPPHYTPPGDSASGRAYAQRLERATLEALRTHYAGQTVPIWNRPFESIDFEKRIRNIIYWLMRAVNEASAIYPVDPAWVMAQIMHESYFYEFAVSNSLAVGICQFVNRTANEYDMLCAGDSPAHAAAPFQRPELAMRQQDYEARRRDRRHFVAANQAISDISIDSIMAQLRAGELQALQERAGAYGRYQEQLRAIEEQIRQARNDYMLFLRTNLEGRDIFNDTDLQFILQFDERVTYKKPVLGMVKMLARSLRVRSGNIIAAASAYNAGLSRTIADGLYRPYGKIPSFEETVTYISRVLVLHHELVKRMV